MSDRGEDDDLYAQCARAYWDPALRAEFGDAAIEAAWADPVAAQRRLLDLSVEKGGKLSPAARQALTTLAGVELAYQDAGHEWSPQAAPIPTNKPGREAEIERLLNASADAFAKGGKLSAEEQARLQQLIGTDLAVPGEMERAGISPQQQRKAGRSRMDQLVEKSLDGVLSQAERVEYSALIHQQLLADGRIIGPEETGENYTPIDEMPSLAGDENG